MLPTRSEVYFNKLYRSRKAADGKDTCVGHLVEPEAAPRKPLFKQFMGINGHFTFKSELCRQVGRLVRNYHHLNWDMKQPGDFIPLPVCVNQSRWKNNV